MPAASHNGSVPPWTPSPPDIALGHRVRDQRVRRHVSQSQAATAAGLSGSYLSLIESGRRKATLPALERIASALGCSVEYLRTGRGGPDDSEVELELRFAEMALRTGDAQTARERFDRVRLAARDRGLHEVELDARWGWARATEAVGSLESAIVEYEALAAEDQLPVSLDRSAVLTALCRAYRECGDLSHAVEVGESAVRALEESRATSRLTDAEVALASTLVACYFERGDLTRAHLLAQDTLARAEENGSPQARAAALWNAGLVSETRGDLRTARAYVERALALYSETDNARATALLRVAFAWLLLREDEPAISDAERLLARALDDLPVVGSALDVAYAETELARCRLLRGDWQAALSLAEAVVGRLAEYGTRLESARARLLVGDALLLGGDIEAAIDSYAEAAAELRAFGAHREAASAWRELAERLIGTGRTTEALDAYRSASDAAGVQAPPSQLDPVRRSTPAAPAEAEESLSHRSSEPSQR